MGIVQKDAFRTMLLSYLGIIIGYVNKGILFLLILTTNQIGLVNLLLTVGLFFAQVANFGTINTVSKFFWIIRNENRGHYGFFKVMLYTVVVGILITTLLFFFSMKMVTGFYSEKSPDFISYYYWIIPIGIANVMYTLLESYIRAMFKNVISVFVYEVVLRLLLTVLLLTFSFGLFAFDVFIAFFSLIYFVPVLVLFIYFFHLGELKHLKEKITIPKRLTRILFQYGVFSYMNSLGGIAITTIDVTMIASYVGLAGTGVYTTMQFFTSALQIPFRSVFRVASPFVPLHWKERDMIKMNRLYKDVSSVSLFLSLLLFLLVWTNRTELFGLLPQGFEDAQWVFLFLILGRLVDVFTGINVTILVTSKKYRVDMYMTVLMLSLVFVLNLLLIPGYGIIGAALSTAIAVTFSNLLRLVYVWIVFKLHPFRWNQLIIILLGILTLVVSELISFMTDYHFITGLLINSLCVLIFFVLPIFYFRVEEQIVDFIRKFLDKTVGMKVGNR